MAAARTNAIDRRYATGAGVAASVRTRGAARSGELLATVVIVASFIRRIGGRAASAAPARPPRTPWNRPDVAARRGERPFRPSRASGRRAATSACGARAGAGARQAGGGVGSGCDGVLRAGRCCEFPADRPRRRRLERGRATHRSGARPARAPPRGGPRRPPHRRAARGPAVVRHPRHHPDGRRRRDRARGPAGEDDRAGRGGPAPRQSRHAGPPRGVADAGGRHECDRVVPGSHHRTSARGAGVGSAERLGGRPARLGRDPP